MVTLAGGENSCPAQITDDPFRVSPVAHRQPANVVAQQLGNRIVQCFIRIGHDQVRLAGFRDAQITVGCVFQGPDHVTPGDNAGKFARFVCQQCALVPSRESLLRDFRTNSRMLVLVTLAVPIGIVSALVAKALLWLHADERVSAGDPRRVAGERSAGGNGNRVAIQPGHSAHGSSGEQGDWFAIGGERAEETRRANVEQLGLARRRSMRRRIALLRHRSRLPRHCAISLRFWVV